MDKNVRVRAVAIVPENQAGGPYIERDCTIIPVRIERINFNEHYSTSRDGNRKIREGINSLQEITVKGNLEVPRGSRLALEFDTLSLGRVNHWPAERRQGKVIRTEPYAVEVRYKRD